MNRLVALSIKKFIRKYLRISKYIRKLKIRIPKWTILPIIFTLTGIIVILIYSIGFSKARIAETFGIAFFTSGSSFLTGCFLGLLLGIPSPTRMNDDLTKEEINESSDSKLELEKVQLIRENNNNLGQISDWLTKIFIGIFLSQISSIPSFLRNIGNSISSSIYYDKEELVRMGTFFFVGIIIYYLYCGFFSGFLWARIGFINLSFHPNNHSEEIDLTEIFARAEKQLLQPIITLSESKVLDNFNGFIRVLLVDKSNKILPEYTQDTSRVMPGQPFKILIFFCKNDENKGIYEPIKINEGQDSDSTIFAINLDSDIPGNGIFKEKSINVDLDSNSRPLENFQTQISFNLIAPTELNSHKIWVEAFQKGRLITVVKASVRVIS